jgi:chorismate mutase
MVDFNKLFSDKEPILISGPCSAETRDQVVQTALQLKQLNKIHLFRAGIWKPRTKPGMFEGVGSIGLKWLTEARELTNIPLTVEVATPKHTEEALKHGIDCLWIGARTVANPFSVQALAEALKGIDIPVLIKNPTNPDIELWVGAIERILNAGIKDIVLVHRGFTSYAQTEYRNPPMWQLAIEIKRRFPQFPMLCDPSHIAGKRSLLKGIAQQSIDLNYNGLMIESHIDPENAWSDSAQQITPEKLSDLLNNLLWRSGEVNPSIDYSELTELRTRIDQKDDELIHLLSERMKIADEIGKFKKNNNITILQTERWNQILERALQKCDALGLSKDFIRNYFESVHLESIFHQNNVMNKNEHQK